MFHLTPQEKSALGMLLAVCIVGTAVHYAFHPKMRIFKWMNTSSRPYTPKIIDINKANAKQLESLPGIGPKTAKNIIAHREENGAFTSVLDLRRVKGMTKANVQKVLAYYEREHDS